MVIDIILILSIVVGTFIGYKKGFVKVIIKLGGFVLALVLAFTLKNSVANFLAENMGLKGTVSLAVEGTLTKFANNTNDVQNKTDIKILEKTINSINKTAENQKKLVISKYADKVSDFVLKGISFIGIFIIVIIITGIIGLILDTVVKLPVLSTLNGTLGAVIQFVLMMFRIFVVLAIISFLSPLQITTFINEYIETTCITKWLYENNIITNIIGSKLL